MSDAPRRCIDCVINNAKPRQDLQSWKLLKLIRIALTSSWSAWPHDWLGCVSAKRSVNLKTYIRTVEATCGTAASSGKLVTANAAPHICCILVHLDRLMGQINANFISCSQFHCTSSKKYAQVARYTSAVASHLTMVADHLHWHY